MVIPSQRNHSGHRRGAMNIELVVAMGILITAMIPLAYAWMHELKLARSYYRDAIATEIVDGETELLAGGEWRAFADGEHVLKPPGAAAANLPPGRLLLSRHGNQLAVEWNPEAHGRRIRREITVQ